MSQLIIPALALGGVYLLYDGMTKKKKHSSHSSSSSSRSGSSGSRSSHSRSKKSRKNKSSSSSSSSSSPSSYSKKIRLHTNKTAKYTNKTAKHTNKTAKHRTSKKELVVYYTYGSVKGKKWVYKNLPGGWKLKHKKNINHTKYTKHVVFMGPKQNRDKMEKYLEEAFKYLKQMNIIKYYKISRA